MGIKKGVIVTISVNSFSTWKSTQNL